MKKPIMCILFCMLMIVSTIVPVSGITVSEKASLTRGNTLYVGGLGPNNYTKIQDAINDATNGDTVFVYDDSSPYYENINIEKSISLRGENKETTVILGDESPDWVIVNISASDVSISGFTIQPNTGRPDGIQVAKGYTYPDYWNIVVLQNVSIYNNIIKKTWRGILGIRLNHGDISGNIIEDCNGEGILLFISSNTTITNNVVSNSSYRGIEIDGLWNQYRIRNHRNPVPENNIISQNTVRANRWGIALNSGPVNTKITNNNILDNHEIGIQIIDASKTEITRNNFMGNTQDASFMVVCVLRYPRFLQNSWDSNYWGEPKKLPVPITGELWFMPFPRIPIGISFPNFDLTQFKLQWSSFDKHPAQEPYDIGV
jgi:parallel beta-helix repeat protein